MNELSDMKKCCTENSIENKLRILALHGYRQNAAIFKEKTGAFRKCVHKWVQFTYITAPHKLTSQSSGDGGSQENTKNDQYSWFFNNDDLTYNSHQEGGPAIGYADSVKYIEEIFIKEGPFDGVIGFSQGACFLSLLCDLQQKGLTNINFNFAVFFSGYRSRCLPHLKCYNEIMTIPSLHVFGENDLVIPHNMSMELLSIFDDSVVVKHKGGHYVPSSFNQKCDIEKFFKHRILDKEQREKF